MRHTIRSNSGHRPWLVVAFLMTAHVAAAGAAHAMGNDMKLHRDTGVIGEKKTTHGTAMPHDPTTGITYVRKKDSFVAPLVMGEIAHFDLNGDYDFKFKCLGWEYSLQAYWAGADGTPHPDVTANRVGFWVHLESPDKTTVIQTQEVDIPVTAPLTTLLTPAQLEVLQRETYVEDPFAGEERLVAAQQALMWLIEKGLAGYNVMQESPMQFTVERIGRKEFVKAEAMLRSQEAQTMKKCVLWALNCRGYRLKGTEHVRKMESWICWIIDDAPNYSNLATKTRMILETLTFERGRNVYVDLIDE